MGRWDGQATVDLQQQAALLHATGPMQVGGRPKPWNWLRADYGTPFGRFHVDSLAHLGWFYLTTCCVLRRLHLPPATTITTTPNSAAALGAASRAAGRDANCGWVWSASHTCRVRIIPCRRQTMVLCCNPHLRLRLHLHLHERTHLDTAQEKCSTGQAWRTH